MLALLFLLLFGAFALALLLFTLAFAAVGVGALAVLGLMFAAVAFMRTIIRRQ